MENQNEILDSSSLTSHSTVEAQHIISVEKFILLCIASFGTYEIWWMYKAWKYYQQKEEMDIMPAARALFCIFYLYSLLEKIEYSAKEKGYTESYSAMA